MANFLHSRGLRSKSLHKRDAKKLRSLSDRDLFELGLRRGEIQRSLVASQF